MSQLVDTVRQDIITAIKTDKLVLPTLPEAALRVREVAEDPDANLSQLEDVIGNDAALSARIVRVANSPLLRSNKAIEDIKGALMRLGIEYTCNIATGLAMQQMFQATSDMIDKRLREVWARSSEIAGICHVLCKHYTKLRPDQATLAGLVHQIGVLPILTYAEEHPSLLGDSLTLETVIHQLQGPMGDLILKSWDFAPELIHIPSEHLKHNRMREHADYADLVTIASLQCDIEKDADKDIDYSKITSFARLGMDPDMQFAEAEDLSAEMEAAIALFQ